MKKKQIFGYNFLGEKTEIPHCHIVISRSITPFPLKHPDAKGTGMELGPKDVKKKFRVRTINGADMGVCEFVGFSFGSIPDSPFKKALDEKYRKYLVDEFLVFQKTKNNACIFIVNPLYCDAKTINKK